MLCNYQRFDRHSGSPRHRSSGYNLTFGINFLKHDLERERKGDEMSPTIRGLGGRARRSHGEGDAVRVGGVAVTALRSVAV